MVLSVLLVLAYGSYAAKTCSHLLAEWGCLDSKSHHSHLKLQVLRLGKGADKRFNFWSFDALSLFAMFVLMGWQMKNNFRETQSPSYKQGLAAATCGGVRCSKVSKVGL